MSASLFPRCFGLGGRTVCHRALRAADGTGGGQAVERQNEAAPSARGPAAERALWKRTACLQSSGEGVDASPSLGSSAKSIAKPPTRGRKRSGPAVAGSYKARAPKPMVSPAPGAELAALHPKAGRQPRRWNPEQILQLKDWTPCGSAAGDQPSSASGSAQKPAHDAMPPGPLRRCTGTSPRAQHEAPRRMPETGAWSQLVTVRGCVAQGRATSRLWLSKFQSRTADA